MFSSKSNRGKWVWAFVDLLVVIIGVYTAFLIQNSAAKESSRKEKMKIYSALKMELEEFRVVFPQFADGNESYLKKIEDEKAPSFLGWRFIEPQYGYQIIEFAINNNDSEIIDFETYENLKNILVGIKQLEHTERLITELAGEYQILISDLPENHELNLKIKAENRARLYRFKMFLNTRVGILRRISEFSLPLLDHVNEVLGPEVSLEIDKKFIDQFASWFDSEQEAIDLAAEHFPNVPEEDVKKIYQEGQTTE